MDSSCEATKAPSVFAGKVGDVEDAEANTGLVRATLLSVVHD